MNVDDGVLPGEEDEGGGGEANAEIEAEAKALGWVPEAEFKGRKDYWVSAEEFVERGKHLMPVLIENNKRLQKQLLTRDQKIDTLTKRFDEEIERLDKHHREAAKRQLDAQEARLREELKEARQADDFDREEEIRDQLGTVKAAKADVDKPVTKPKSKDEDASLSPEFQEWNAENPWFGKDVKKTELSLSISEKLKSNTKLTGRAFLDEVTRLLDLELKKVDEDEDEDDKRPRSKVETGNNLSRGSKSRGFEGLPSEAKAACLALADDFVGPDKKYKKLSEWKEVYANRYGE